MPEQQERLVKFLSASGAASRRAAGELVKAGRVTVNGRTTLEPGFLVSPGDTVTLDGKPVKPVASLHYILLNKPRGYVCTNADPHAPLKAIDLIRLDPPVRLFSAGELARIRTGIRDQGELLRVISIERIGKCRYRIVLNEGRKREIRRLTAAAGAPTIELRRVRIGGLELGDLPEGAFRELSPEEVALTLKTYS